MTAFVLYAVIFTIYSLGVCWLFLTSPGRVWVKTLVATLFVVMSTAIAFSFDSFVGYPSSQKIKRDSLLVGVVIREPTPEHEGKIYIWVVEPESKSGPLSIFEYKPDYKDPRAYKIPYTKENQKKMQAAKEAMEAGNIVKMGKQGEKEGAEANSAGEQDGGEAGDQEGSEDGQGDVNRDLPDIRVIDPRSDRVKS